MVTMCHVTENFKRLCLIRADLSRVSESAARGMMGEVHVKEYKIILRFGAEHSGHRVRGTAIPLLAISGVLLGYCFNREGSRSADTRVYLVQDDFCESLGFL